MPGRPVTRPAIRGVPRGLLVAHVDDPDPFIETAIVDVLNVHRRA